MKRLLCVLLSGSMMFTVLSCGKNEESDNTENGFIYEIDDDNVIITGYEDDEAEEIEIPNRIDGKKVVRIDDNAFEDFKELTEVDLPTTLIEIGDSVFEGCKSLEEIEIPKNVEEIGDDIFKGCVSLEKIVILGDETPVEKEIFEDCDNLETIYIFEDNPIFDEDYEDFIDGVEIIKIDDDGDRINGESKIESSSSAAVTSRVEDEYSEMSSESESSSEYDIMTYDYLENNTIKWMSDWDINPNAYNEIPPELELFQEMYCGVIEYHPVAWSERLDALAAAIISGEGIDFFPASDMDVYPKGAIKGMFVPVDDYVDFSSELWKDVQSVNDSLVWGDSHYILCTEVTGDNCAVIYNKSTIMNAGLTDPAELFENGEWTWDTFYEMMDVFADPANGFYGVDGYWTEIAIPLTTGVPYIGLENGRFVNNLMNPELERANSLLLDIHDNNLRLDTADYNWLVQPQFIGEGKTLFYPCGLWTLYRDKDMWSAEFGEDVSFVPMPADPEADAHYIPAGLNGYLMCKDGSNPEGVIAFAECNRLALLDESAQEIESTKLKEEYGWTDEMIEMKQTMNQMSLENPVFDFYNCVNDEVTFVFDDAQMGIRSVYWSGIPWSEVIDGCYSDVDAAINEANALAQ